MLRWIRRFGWTLSTLVVVPLALWPIRAQLMVLLIPEFHEPYRFYLIGPHNEGYVHLQLVRLATLLLVVPVFAAEVWLAICERTGTLAARRFTLPFALTTGLVQSALFELVRRVQPFLFAHLV
jgi:hypothetical protein